MIKKIAYLTDVHLEEEFPIENGVNAKENWLKILADVKARNITEVVFGGDIGTKDSNRWFFASMRDFNLKITLGNHDYFDEVTKHYKNEHKNGFKELYYAYEDEFFQYIYLDSSTGAVSGVQLDWLRDQLKSTKPILLFIHHPILAVSTKVDDMFSLENREQVKALLNASQAHVNVFCGHYHMLDEAIAGNITQNITLASSYQLEKVDHIKVNTDTFGYRIITLNRDQVSSEVIFDRNFHS